MPEDAHANSIGPSETTGRPVWLYSASTILQPITLMPDGVEIIERLGEQVGAEWSGQGYGFWTSLKRVESDLDLVNWLLGWWPAGVSPITKIIVRRDPDTLTYSEAWLMASERADYDHDAWNRKMETRPGQTRKTIDAWCEFVYGPPVNDVVGSCERVARMLPTPTPAPLPLGLFTFHEAWGEAKGRRGYDKSLWNRKWTAYTGKLDRKTFAEWLEIIGTPAPGDGL